MIIKKMFEAFYQLSESTIQKATKTEHVFLSKLLFQIEKHQLNVDLCHLKRNIILGNLKSLKM